MKFQEMRRIYWEILCQTQPGAKRNIERNQIRSDLFAWQKETSHTGIFLTETNTTEHFHFVELIKIKSNKIQRAMMIKIIPHINVFTVSTYIRYKRILMVVHINTLRAGCLWNGNGTNMI